MSKIIFPRPFALAIDDLGWMLGKNEGEGGYGPYRLGMNRNPTLNDYKALVTIARNAGVRLQGLFILGEMDRENILGEYPTTTFMRRKWDNSENISDLQIEIMEYVKEQAASIEFGLHGIGHEFWPDEGKRRRAEWYNTEDDYPWPEEEIIKHVDCFVEIMAQYGLSKENGHSFPESFVPCAYSYYWNPKDGYSLGSVLSKYGVKYANTDFTQISELSPPAGPNGGGFDHQVHVMNRFNYGNLWSEMGKLPETPLADQETDFIETHWPNLLGWDSSEQQLITEKWVNYFRKVQRSNNRYCSKNTSQHHSQWLYKRYTKLIETKPGRVEIDNRNMPDEAYQGNFPGNLVLKIRLESGEHISKAKIGNVLIPAYLESESFGFLYLPQLKQQQYLLEYEIGSERIQNSVWHEETVNVFATEIKEGKIKIDLCVYGSQTIKLINDQMPERVISNNSKISVKGWKVEKKMLHIKLCAHDIQGETGAITVVYY